MNTEFGSLSAVAMAFSVTSQRMLRLFAGFWRLCALM